jgi:recombinational DNA repair protein RecR
MSDLRDDLLAIDGVGPKTAKQIEDVVTTDNTEAVELLADALEYFERDNPAYARNRVEDAYEVLD